MNQNPHIIDPFKALEKLQEALSRASTVSKGTVEPASSRAFPPINLFEQGEDLVAMAELPGVDKSELDIQIFNNKIRIAGKRAIEYKENYSVHRRERRAGQFDRTIDLSVEIDAEQARAEFREGVLTIFLPRAESDKPRTIPIH